MKVGDLVKWNHPEEYHQDLGIIVNIRSASLVHVLWQKNPEHSGEYDSHHTHFKILAPS
tara:strand:- start:258 stop:434 length:177 start_codon:yes stop_codon:yes gene_type:complete